MNKLFTIFLALIISINLNAQDTFSICAVDTATGEVGSAGASCLDDDDIPGGVLIISDVHPGVGVIHTQSYWNSSNQQYARQLMNDGYAPQEIITLLVLNDAQNNPGIRQYGIVDLSGDSSRSAAYTGNNCLDYKNHILGPNYAIQGNILLGQEILDSIESRFLSAEGSLACRLMEALQGANVVGADTRCAPYGVSSLSAFVRVAKPGDPVDDLYLDLLVPKVLPGVDPIDSLQTLVDQWGGCNFTGIADVDLVDMVEVYPNPANDLINFQLSEELSIKDAMVVVYSLRGQKVAELLFGNEKTVQLNTGQLASGLHTFQLIGDGYSIHTGKFIVE